MPKTAPAARSTRSGSGEKRHFRKRGLFQVSFRLTCLGGPHPDIGGTPEADVKIVRQQDGRDLAVYSYLKDGDLITVERYR